MSANLRAFLAMIRWCEGTAGENGYRTLFGGGLFDSFDDHPRQVITRSLGGKPISSSAAGAYQFLSRTWDECKKALHLPDFSPASQDLAATFLIKRRGALADVEAGRVEVAIRKCAKEWASLPGSPYGQPVKSMGECILVYSKAGGAFSAEGAPPPEPFVPRSLHDIVTGSKEPAVSPFVLPVFEFLSGVVPTLIRNLGKGEQSEKNAKLAETVVGVAKEALGAVNEQEVLERVKADPAALQTVDQAVGQAWLTIAEAGGGGIAGAREYNLQAAAVPAGRQPAFIISLLLLLFPLLLLIDVFFLHSAAYTSELRTQIVTGVLMVLSMVGGFWLGSSFTTSSTRGVGARPQ